ncbi:MAG: sugar ABC transporter permease [Clostridia bacterium]|nr:sugar ABC transporter permease [Clostridia bacterium]
MTNEIKLENQIGNKKTPKKRKIASLDKRKARVGWLFVLPFLIGFAFVYLPIVGESFWLAFNQLTIVKGGGYNLNFVGFENFVYAFNTDANFTQTLITGIGELIFQVPAILLFSLFMAVLLNQKMAGRAAFRAIFFLPVVLATGIMESIEASNILGSYMGESSGIDDGSGGSAASSIVSAIDIEQLFSNMKVGQELVTYVVGIINDIYGIVNRSGVQMLIFLAGLQSISPAIYEACKIDGATGWETFWKITFPMISPMILVNAVYTIIDSFTTETNTVMTYISTVASKTNGEVISTAMSWIYFLIVVLILLAVAGIMSMYVFYQRKD